MKNNIRIVSDGTAMGTLFFAIDRETGKEMEFNGVSKMEFCPLEPDGILRVKLTFNLPEIDVVAEAAD